MTCWSLVSRPWAAGAGAAAKPGLAVAQPADVALYWGGGGSGIASGRKKAG